VSSELPEKTLLVIGYRLRKVYCNEFVDIHSIWNWTINHITNRKGINTWPSDETVYIFLYDLSNGNVIGP